ncbi:ABC transporter permease [Halomarina rubra]|uniref:ABC transporter permease n=1 Tax=Halomarina rubra TaxID=2071873 RepID=A0ABD6B174_9EURY|nr:ABC transporter permease [Halomarina rubra]
MSSEAGSDGSKPDRSGTEWGDRARAGLARLVEASAFERALISLAALVLSIAIGALVILAAGRTATCETAATTYFGYGFCYDPFRVYDRLFLGALGNPINPLFDPLHGNFAAPFTEGWTPFNDRLAYTLTETTVLVLTGLSVAVAFKAGIFNIGTQGQMVIGGLASTLVMLALVPVFTGLATVALLPIGIVVGAVFGGLYGAIPGALKAYADANEVITTIMLNFVASSVALYLVREQFKDPDSFSTKTNDLPAGVEFPQLLYAQNTAFSVVALLFVLALVAATYYLLRHTSFGYDLRTSGLQAAAAEYGGVNSARTIVASMTISGALAGIGGTVYVLMYYGYFQPPVPSYGFDGITVAILAGNNPVGVVPAAFLFGVLKSGAISIQTDPNVTIPIQLVGVLRGLIILFVAMPEFFRLVGKRFTDAGRRSREGGSRVADAVRSDGGVAGGETDE